MAKISLTLIQTFYQVARHGSFSGAARDLNLSYQSAANHVRRLEQILQGKLIDSEQGAKRISLTPRGRALYSLLHPELDIMLERLTKLIENQRSSLRVGMPQAIFFYLFPRVLSRFRDGLSRNGRSPSTSATQCWRSSSRTAVSTCAFRNAISAILSCRSACSAATG